MLYICSKPYVEALEECLECESIAPVICIEEVEEKEEIELYLKLIKILKEKLKNMDIEFEVEEYEACFEKIKNQIEEEDIDYDLLGYCSRVIINKEEFFPTINYEEIIKQIDKAVGLLNEVENLMEEILSNEDNSIIVTINLKFFYINTLKEIFEYYTENESEEVDCDTANKIIAYLENLKI